MTDRVAIFGSQPTKVRRLDDGSDVPVVGLSEATEEHVTATNGVALKINSLAQTFTYDGSGNLQTANVVHNGVTYTQTFTYNAGKLIGVSAWVAQ